MPINRNALIRYRTIDKCLQNRRRKWTIENLIDACNEALYEYEGIDRGVSLRTIRLDLSAMRSDRLGYNAPIVVTDKKYYSYEDPEYSISHVPLSAQDLNILQEVSHLLRQFKGFSHFREVTEMINRLDDKVYSEKHQQAPVIDFEKNELLTGIEWLDILYRAIIEQTTLQLTYQSFKARSANDLVFYPYLLKEYRNRWFVLGMIRNSKEIITFALDRIHQVVPLPGEVFREHSHFNPQTYFDSIVGVTRNTGDTPIPVVFLADRKQAPYIKTKPIHPSQQIIEENKDGVLFSITVIPNFEWEREMIGFGEAIKVISPAHLVRRIRRKVKLMYEVYHEEG